MRTLHTVVALLLSSSLLTSACREATPGAVARNIERVRVGMTEAEVRAITGDPAKTNPALCIPTTVVLSWADGTEITFVEDQVSEVVKDGVQLEPAKGIAIREGCKTGPRAAS